MREPTRSAIGRRAVAALVIAFAVLAGLASPSAGSAAVTAAGLERFGTCGGFLGYVKRHARRIVEPWGLPGGVYGIAVPAAEGAEDEAEGGPVAGVDYSGTNVQEAGVDEPDIVKTDGSRLFTLAGGRLSAVDLTGPEPVLLGSLALDDAWSGQLLLHGDRLVVLSGGGGVIPLRAGGGSIAPDEPYPWTPRAVLTEIDVSDPTSMAVLQTLSVDGSLVGARLAGSIARVVVASGPSGIAFEAPAGSGAAAEEAAKRRNQKRIDRSGVRNWAPSYTLENLVRDTTVTRRAASCRQMTRPDRFSGLGMLTVLTLDLERGLQPIDSDAVFAGGEIVYASQESLYVATQRWIDWAEIPPGEEPPPVTTEIHRFDTSSQATTGYRSSGRVQGHLLNQWAMSEHEGYLRVASTEEPIWWDTPSGRTAESRVTVLDISGPSLAPVGEVTGLGRGERIYAVRFVGDTGYVVTFRQVDPLYVVDLSSPTSPSLAGELELLGYSAYLHPIGDRLLLGVGQDATPEGQVLGTQVSVFDVSDPASPRLVDRRGLAPGWSDVEWDHHAFLWWPATGLAVVPVQASLWDEETGTVIDLGGAIGLHAGPEGLGELGRVTHEGAAIRRSLVARGVLYTVSDAGLEASTLDSLAELSWLPFPAPPPPDESPGEPPPGQTEPGAGAPPDPGP